MHAAFLFDTDDDKYEGNYYWAVRDLIFKTGIIQASGRHMKMSVGDVAWHVGGRDPSRRMAALEAVYFQPEAAFIYEDRLRGTFGKAEVFAVVFENMTREIALELHRALTPDKRYLGFKEAVLEFGPHLVVYRNLVGTEYRLQGSYCRVFYSMSEEDSKDHYALEAMRELGFDDVDWEDSGARKTIFDDYDTPEHFEQVAAFRALATPYLPDGEDGAFELAMILEDLNPRLFNALGAAVRTLSIARNEEDVAQVAVSGRRYMEALTDALFPPRAEHHNGRKVGQAEYKNRLWAYIEMNVPPGDERLTLLGKEGDRLSDELNGGLHGERPSERIEQALADAAVLTATLLALNPIAARKPYLGFEKRIITFFKDGIARRDAEAASSV
ncbi:MAG: hypothetical protein PSV23_16175 [Brevundimonas sp.]|uniref:hypothetical protein n=1 Tax=Brevundimonas sp. TaxID=1871086 RepID=UPI00248A8874|nr:hypothetical protein [Brevundimonas sp.]MDI1328329.1 hypothetical protein [Brevundimonas sp.]